jgi:hypothetical protein
MTEETMPSLTFKRVCRAQRLVVGAYLITVVALMIGSGDPKAIDWWLLVLPMFFWITAPIIGPNAVSWGSGSLSARVVLLAYTIIASIGGIYAFVDAVYFPTNSTSPIAVFFFAFYQWGLLLVFLLSFVVVRSVRSTLK